MLFDILRWTKFSITWNLSLCVYYFTHCIKPHESLVFQCTYKTCMVTYFKGSKFEIHLKIATSLEETIQIQRVLNAMFSI